MTDSKLRTWWFKKCEKHKSLDWIDDHIIFYVWTKPYDIYKSVRHWFYCNWNSYHWRLIKAAFLAHPWDYGFILELEECQLDKQIHWFKHHQLMVDEQYNEINRTLRGAKHCLHTMRNDTDLFHYDGTFDFIAQKWQTNDDGKRELVDADENEEDNGLYRLDGTNSHYVYDGPYVNRRNALRFFSRETVESDFFKNGNMEHEIYVTKCKHLYYLIRERYTELWWD